MSTTETVQPIGGTLEEIAGLYLFNQKELVVYLKLMAASRDMSLSTTKRGQYRSNAAAKLRNVIEKRMPVVEKMVLEAKKQAETQRKHQERLQFVEYALSLFNSKQREDYDALLAGSTDPKNSAAKRTACAKVVANKLSLITAKQADKDRKYQERLQFVEYALSLFTSKQREDYDTLLAGATDPKNTPDQQKKCADHAMQKLRLIIAKHAEEEKRAAMTPEELAMYENEPERVAAKAEKTRNQQAAHTKHSEKEAALCLAGDTDALARQAATKEAARKRQAAVSLRKKQEMFAEIAELFRKHGGVSTVFGEGGERQESIMRKVKEIMGNYAGVAHPIGETTSKKWLNDHGDVSIEEKLTEGEWAAYILITRTGIIPGKEEECDETKLFITEVKRDPLWRIEQDDGDLKRMSPPQATSVVHSYLLANCDTAYDVTSLEAACQFYLEDEIGLPHGMCLHKKAGSGNRLENSMTKAELKLFLSGELKGWSLVLSIIRVTDCVFAAVDPDDPERSPPLIAASVPTHDGTDTVYRIRVGGKNQSFPDTPSVVADRTTNKATKEKNNARHQKRKRGAAESVDSTESPEEMEEETAKKRKI
jgi:hypothetical protein